MTRTRRKTQAAIVAKRAELGDLVDEEREALDALENALSDLQTVKEALSEV